MPYSSEAIESAMQAGELPLALPDPNDENISDYEFNQQMEAAWQVCDRFDLQTDIAKRRAATGAAPAFSTGSKTAKLPKATPTT